jgi:hypothetical protein
MHAAVPDDGTRRLPLVDPLPQLLPSVLLQDPARQEPGAVFSLREWHPTFACRRRLGRGSEPLAARIRGRLYG